jgi:glutathione synthase/RimK-type ligase-like ATP-grasp enzyme
MSEEEDTFPPISLPLPPRAFAPTVAQQEDPSLTLGAVYTVPVSSGDISVPSKAAVTSAASGAARSSTPPLAPLLPSSAKPRLKNAVSTDSQISLANMAAIYSADNSKSPTPTFTHKKSISSADSSLSGQEPFPSSSSHVSQQLSAATAAKQKPLKPKLHRKTSSVPAYAIPIAAAEAPLTGEESDRIRLGICAMDKKARSKPMAEILSRLDESLFHVVFFGDDVIANKPIQEWPKVEVLIAFYSKGYPLQKAKEYVALNKPFVLNDLDMQEQLKDRRRVYDLLEASGIDVPRHVFVSKDGYVSTGSGDGNRNGDTQVQEFDDHIEINGVAIHKPFVEKPCDADDHNIAIYYPTSAGGGCKKLFRKIGNRSSEFYPDINEVRRDGSYIYEEFVETQGTDVKMYTVGPEYGHAEARKSPTVDGKVQRNADGKEIRFPVILTLSEKEIARRIVLQFKQFVCGFDLLRVQEGHSVVSYVCDVNGFSFVKNSRYV